MRRAFLGAAACMLLLMPSMPALAQEACGAGLVLTYRSEEGPPEDYRDSFVFDLDASDPGRVLHYVPADNAAEWLADHTGGTGIPFRGLAREGNRDGTSRLYRFLDARPDSNSEVVTALLVDMMVYWPECIGSGDVESWRALASR